MAKSPSISRREFVTLTISALGSLIAVVVGLPAIGYLVSPALKTQKEDVWIPLGLLESYKVGEPILFMFTRSKAAGWEKTIISYGVYIVRKEDGSVDVFSNVCTHLGCHVTWQDDSRQYSCPCHDARFDIEGKIVSGPPPRPMNKYETQIVDGKLSIRLQRG